MFLSAEFVFFKKCSPLFNVFNYFCLFVNKYFAYLKGVHLKKRKTLQCEICVLLYFIHLQFFYLKHFEIFWTNLENKILYFFISIYSLNLISAKCTCFGKPQNLIPMNSENGSRQLQNLIPVKFAFFKVLKCCVRKYKKVLKLYS